MKIYLLICQNDFFMICFVCVYIYSYIYVHMLIDIWTIHWCMWFLFYSIILFTVVFCLCFFLCTRWKQCSLVSGTLVAHHVGGKIETWHSERSDNSLNQRPNLFPYMCFLMAYYVTFYIHYICFNKYYIITFFFFWKFHDKFILYFIIVHSLTCYIPTAVSLSFTPPSLSDPLYPRSTPFRKVQASHGYQSNIAYQVALKVNISLHIKAGQGSPVEGKRSLKQTEVWGTSYSHW